MEGKCNISQYRNRLDKTLASQDLANEETLKTLVRNQIEQSSQCDAQEYIDNVVEKRNKELSNFLSMLRSASSTSDNEGSKADKAPHGGWKMKLDNEEYRVMYREGPEGTPFHTLLLEGCVDGPIDNGLCVAWESGLYQQWWPQFSFPTFKVVSSECLQKVRIGEQISLVRMKLPWPVSAREALVHYFEFEYYEDDLIVVLLNSMSDLESIDKSTHGFTWEGIPDVQKVVRVDLVGGFAFKKLTANRSYFRMIMNLDIKLDFVPPTLINFVSRQVLGSGFKLFKKEVASASNDHADFGKALKEPLYTQIREALYSDNISTGVLQAKNLKIDTSIPSEEYPRKTIQADKEVLIYGHANHSRPDDAVIIAQEVVSGSEQIEESERLHEIVTECRINNEKKVIISSEVGQALGTLEKMISIFREYRFDPQNWSLLRFTDSMLTNVKKETAKDHLDYQVSSNGGVHVEAPMSESLESSSHEPRNSFDSHDSRHAMYISDAIEAKNNKMELASAKEEIQSSSEAHHTSLSFSVNDATKTAVLEKSTNGELAGLHGNAFPKKKKNKKLRFFCFHFTSRRRPA